MVNSETSLNQTPLVSVIVPNYNHGPFLASRLRSISEQTYRNIEIILLDDASEDNSVDILEAYSKDESRVTYFKKNIVNTGVPFQQWQKGLELAVGEFVWIAESDDLSDTRFLATMVADISKSAEIGIAYCRSKKIDRFANEIGDFELMSPLIIKNIWKQNFVLNGCKLITDFMPFRNIIPNASAALFRATLLNKYVLKRKINLSRLEDWLLYIDLMQDCDVAYSLKALNYCRVHQGSVTRSHSVQSYAETVKQRLFILRRLSTFQNSDGIMIKRALSSLFEHRHKFKWANQIALELKSKALPFGLFGFNDLTKYIIESLMPDVAPRFIIDKKFQGNQFNDIPIISVEQTPVYHVQIVAIMSPQYHLQMRDQLRSQNYRNRILVVGHQG
jgi:glycosyltransferase involved in cell wall biosynthesis